MRRQWPNNESAALEPDPAPRIPDMGIPVSEIIEIMRQRAKTKCEAEDRECGRK